MNNNKQGGLYKKGGFKKRGTRKPKSEFAHRVLDIARVVRVTKGGKRFSFRAAVVIGDEKGKIGFGVAQGKDVDQSIQKAMGQGKKGMVTVNIYQDTIPHEVLFKYKSAKVLLKPAKQGHGVKAGGPVRLVAQLSGLKNLTGKLISRTNNKINIARATIKALESLKLREVKEAVKETEKSEKLVEKENVLTSSEK